MATYFNTELFDPRYLIQIPFGQDENLVYVTEPIGAAQSAWDSATDQLAALNPFSSDLVTIANVEDKSYEIAFPGAEIIVSEVSPSSKLMEHPSETSEVRVDHKVDMPTDFRLEIIAQADVYREVWASIEAHRVQGTNLTLQTKVNTWPNLIISDMPHTESAEKFNTFSMVVQMRQSIIVSTNEAYAPIDASDDASNNRGVLGGTVV
ncbi:MAG: hypothetical protein GY886_12265 [Gammaproteobacteria bacterium]|nr:hypothetical protein [Gammaproteobacteria bacterium]